MINVIEVQYTSLSSCGSALICLIYTKMYFSNTLLCLVTLLTSFTTASVTCVKVGGSATATWTNSEGKLCSWTGVVGSNFGTSFTGGE